MSGSFRNIFIHRFLRRLAWSLLIGFLWVSLVNPVLAQTAGAESQSASLWDFIAALLYDAVTFNSRALMQTLSQPSFTIAAFVALNVIVFVETGLLIGFFLPGDSLLVTVGLISSHPDCGWNLPLLLATVSLSAIIGDSVGYSIGLKTGPKIFCREKSLFFNKDHLLKAQEFYDRHGGKTIILARFVPIIRTFAPVVAGVGRIEYHRFVLFNICGGIGWVCSMILFGRFLPAMLNPLLQPIFSSHFAVEDHVEKVVILVVLASVAPMGIAWLRSKLARKPAMPAAVASEK
jgi:membrane-associated protein